MTCPCKDCQIREVGCHGKCSSYKDWKNEQDDIRAARIQEATIREIMYRPKRRSAIYSKKHLNQFIK